MQRNIIFILFLIFYSVINYAEDGYRLWMRYDLITDNVVREEYKTNLKGIISDGNSETLELASRELQSGMQGLLGNSVPFVSSINKDGIIVIGKWSSSRRRILPIHIVLLSVKPNGCCHSMITL